MHSKAYVTYTHRLNCIASGVAIAMWHVTPRLAYDRSTVFARWRQCARL